MGRSAHFYFVSFQFYFLIEGWKLFNMCYHDYFSEVFQMMDGKWLLLFVSLSKTNVRTGILIRKTIFGDILVSAIFRFEKKKFFFSLNVTYLYNALIL